MTYGTMTISEELEEKQTQMPWMVETVLCAYTYWQLHMNVLCFSLYKYNVAFWEFKQKTKIK